MAIQGLRMMLSTGTWAAGMFLGLAVLPEITLFFHDIAGQPFILADMLTGFALGGFLSGLQLIWMRRWHQRLLPYWLSVSTVGGVLGGFVGGVVSVFIANASSATYFHVLSLPLLLGFIGFGQWMVLRHQTKQAPVWVLLYGLLGMLVAQGAWLPAVLLTLVLGGLLHRWQQEHEPMRGHFRDIAAYRNAYHRLRDAATEATQTPLVHPPAETQQALL